MLTQSERSDWEVALGVLRQTAADLQDIPVGGLPGRPYRRALLAAAQRSVVAAATALKEALLVEDDQ